MRCIHLHLSYFLRHSEMWRGFHIGPMAVLAVAIELWRGGVSSIDLRWWHGGDSS